MQRLFAKLFLIVLTAMLVAPQSASAMPEIFPFDQLKSGMTGKAYTVVDGSGKIENFNVEIIGVTDDGKGSKRMIMAKAYGDVIRHTGGILQGMSGSPVYIDGKLVGALSATLKEMDPYMVFITPIESMIELWRLPDPKADLNYLKIVKMEEAQQKADAKKNKSADGEKNSDADDDAEKNSDGEKNSDAVDDAEKNSDGEKISDAVDGEEKNSDGEKNSDAGNGAEKNSDAEKISDAVDDAKKISVAEKFSDGKKIFYVDESAQIEPLTSNVIGYTRREIQPLALETLQVVPKAIEQGINMNARLEPGSALGVAVIYGDFSLGATGTVTAVNGNRILAFGHPFTHAGNVNFFMTDASVIASVSGVTSNGVKLAGIGKIIGRVNQDRDSGISGILGSFPAVVPISVTIKDKSLDKQETYNATIAYNESLVPKLGASIAYTALSKMADSLAESTVDIDFNITTDAVKDGKLTRKNMFYNASDVGQVAVVELMQALNLVCSNTKEEVNIFGVDVNISFEMDRRTASIVSITPDKKTVKPGDTVNLTVELQPYRKPSEKIILPYIVPLTALQGNLSLEVHGGALVPVNQVATPGLVTADSNRSYEDKIKDFLKSGRNNQLVVELGATGEKSDKELRRGIAQAKRIQARLKKEGKTVAKVDNKIDTNYIIDNVMRTVLTVEKV